MARTTRRGGCLMLAALAALGGCYKFTHTATVDMRSSGIHVMSVSAPTSDQNVKVEVSSPGVPVSVWVVLASDVEEVEKRLVASKEVDRSKVLASQEQQEESVVEAKIPKNQEYAVIVSGPSKRTQVKIKITGS